MLDCKNGTNVSGLLNCPLLYISVNILLNVDLRSTLLTLGKVNELTLLSLYRRVKMITC